ncbi:hypothetical protein ACQ4PT_006727 [Festuca glaucescens]
MRGSKSSLEPDGGADCLEKFDDGMTDLYGPCWVEEHPEFDGAVIYEKAGRMPHGRLGIANEAFDKVEKSTIKSTRIKVSQPEQSGSENEHLRRENRNLRRENEQLRGMTHVVRALTNQGGLDFDALMREGAQHASVSLAPNMLTNNSNNFKCRVTDTLILK